MALWQWIYRIISRINSTCVLPIWCIADMKPCIGLENYCCNTDPQLIRALAIKNSTSLQTSTFNPCCPKGGFYIDPWEPVDKAVITHGHSDHATFGHRSYLCHELTKPILQLRLGDQVYQTLKWNEPVDMNGVRLTLHPAGHIIGSSQ